MRTDEQLLGQVPDFICIDTMLKASPAVEGDDRFIYLEASREKRDQQNETVLSKALEDSCDHFLKFGNIDIDHKSMPAVAKRHGIDLPEAWEIGVPVAARFDRGATFVKARLFKGEGQLAARANMVWESMTRLDPPHRWYPSVGGAVLAKSMGVDSDGSKHAVVTKVRWSNLAISRQPVNQHVSAIDVVPFGGLAKSFEAMGGLVVKSLDAGYGADVASLTGGSALRVQSLDHSPASYFDFRDKIAADLRKRALGDDPGAESIALHCAHQYGLSMDQATEFTERFLRDLSKGIKRSKND